MPSRTAEPYRAAFDDALALLRSAVTKTNKTKHLEGLRLWIAALSCRAISTAEAAGKLLDGGHNLECKILVRSMLDALVDTFLLSRHPEHEERLLRLLRIDVAVDRYERLKYYAAMGDMKIKEFVSRHPVFQEVLAEYDAIKSDSAIHLAKRNQTHWTDGLWSKLRSGEKLKNVPDLDKALHPLGYSVRYLANSLTHHRPEVLRRHMYSRKGGKLGVRIEARNVDAMDSLDWVAFEGCVIILMLADHLVDKFFLGPRYEGRVKRLFKRLQDLRGSLPKKRALV